MLGQVKDNAGSLTRYYYLKDHLGDIKMVLNQSGGVDTYRDYYPFGLTMPGRSMASSADGRYQFNGKEFDIETNDYYFGKRIYDPWHGGWLSTDPRSDKYPAWSPYNYALDNPVIFIDPHGDTVAGIDQAKQAEMMKNMNDADKKQYQQYLNSKTTYQFTDVYNGWQIIQDARSYIGLAYEYGTADLTTNVDCSGFVGAILKDVGVVDEDTQRFTVSTFTSDLGGEVKPVATNSVLWGDIVKYKGHMGFYDPTPIQNPPEGKIAGANLLSARGNQAGTGLQSVDYGVMNSIKWFGVNPNLYRIKY